ncbi:MAG: MarR family transcriptional regulator [Emcibacteraceae bacterium]|nr:MarR family transcriptional regulator [Emcibacteraceae bacterium]
MSLEENNGGLPSKIIMMNRMILNSSRVTQELNRRLKQKLNLSIAKFEALIAIENATDNAITMSNLSKELQVSNANITGLTTRLQADGLIQKAPLASDRRIYSVSLTEKGQLKLEKAVEKHGAWMKELMACVENNEVDFMNGFLDKFDHQIEFFSNKRGA